AKNEGELLAVAALLLASWRLLRHRSRPAVARARLAWFLGAGLPVVAATLLLSAWRSRIPNREHEDYFAMLSLSSLLHRAVSGPPPPPPPPAPARPTFPCFTWHGFWIALPLVLALAWPGLRRRGAHLILAAGLVPFAVGLSAYAVSDRFFRLIYETWDRLLIQ